MKLPAKTRIQSLLFCRVFWNVKQARAWAKKHGFKSADVDVTENQIRLRQDDPSMFQPGTFRTIKIVPKKNLQAVIGRPWVSFTGNPHPKKDSNAKELFDTVHKDWRLHALKHKDFIVLTVKKASGKWNRTQALARFYKLARLADKKYKRIHKIPKKAGKVFTHDDHFRAAKLMLDQFNKYYKAGQFDQYIPKKFWGRRQEK